jgi:hypothetical protein
MDELVLYRDPSTPFGGVDIYINGRKLVDLLREFEKPFAAAEGHPDIAGTYMGRSPSEVFLPSKLLLGEPGQYDMFSDIGKVAVLDCDCGNPGCWPWAVKITTQNDRVVWSDFENCHRGPTWDYSGHPPFTFELQGYMAAIEKSAEMPPNG